MLDLRSFDRPFSRLRFALELAGLFALVTLTAWASLLTDSVANGEAVVWWPNGVLLAFLLLTECKRWPILVAIGFAANVFAHAIMHESWILCLALPLCDMLEICISAYPFARSGRGAPQFSRPKDIILLCLVGVLIAPAISSQAAVLVYSIYAPPPYHFAIHWFSSNALGTLALTPVIFSFFNGDIGSIFARKRLLETIALLTLIVAWSCVVFTYTTYPVFFTLFPPLIFMTVRLGMGGGMLGASSMAFCAIYFTAHGKGPLSVLPNASWQNQLFIIQVLLAGAVLCVALVAVVLNERRMHEQAARKSEQLYRLLAENSHDIIVLTDLDHRREYVSPAVRWLMGWDPQELVGATYHDTIVHPDDTELLTETLRALKEGAPAKTIAYRCQKKDGAYLWVEANISLYCDRVSGEPLGYVNVVRNISERKASEEKLQDAYLALEALASVDGLTGVANRRLFDETLRREWRRASRTKTSLSLLLFDVDHFKLFNDYYGHLRGDSCLRKIAESAVEIAQRPADTVARFGGEEFAIILPDTDRRGASVLAEQLREKVAARHLTHEASPHGIVTVSVGCATIIPAPHSEAERIINAADQALYEAKRAGRNRVAVHADELLSDAAILREE